MVRDGMLWYGMVWYGMVWYGMVWYVTGMVWYGVVWYGVVWYLLDGIQLASTDENDVVAEVPLPVAVRHTRHLNNKHITETVLLNF
jgi:hypothetical protein